MSKFKIGVRIVKNTAIGSLAGGLAGYVTAPSYGNKESGKAGLKVGAVAGAITGIPGFKLAKGAAKMGQVYARGLKATPGSKVGAVLRGVDKAAKTGKLKFIRIRGRIVPIRGK